MAKVIALQMNSVPSVAENLQQVEQALSRLQPTEPMLVVLPECFACFGASDNAQSQIAEPMGDGPIQTALATMAKRYGVWIVAGSMPIQSLSDSRFTATCLVYDDQGERLADYQKIHLFDVQVEDKTGQYCESASTKAGQKLTVLNTPFGRMGVAICYDIRFAEMFTAMSELDLLVLPAAFTWQTGDAHWHALLRARATELQCYLVAANQCGIHPNGRQTYGHSMICSPWGQVLMALQEQPGMVLHRIDFEQLKQIKARMPVGSHRRFTSTLDAEK